MHPQPFLLFGSAARTVEARPTRAEGQPKLVPVSIIMITNSPIAVDPNSAVHGEVGVVMSVLELCRVVSR